MPDEITRLVIERLMNQQERTIDRYGEVVNGMDEVVREITVQLADLPTSSETTAEHTATNVKITEVHHTVKLVIAIVGAAFTLVGVIYAILDRDIDRRIKSQTTQLIETRGAVNKPDIAAYWVDEKGEKRYIVTEPIHRNPEPEKKP